MRVLLQFEEQDCCPKALVEQLRKGINHLLQMYGLGSHHSPVGYRQVSVYEDRSKELDCYQRFFDWLQKENERAGE